MLHAQVHVNVVHHLGKDHTFTTVILDDDVQHNLVTKVVSLLVNQHESGAVVLAHGRSFDADFDFEELVWSNILLHHDACHVKFLVTSNHYELDPFRNLVITSVLVGPNVLNHVTSLEHLIVNEGLVDILSLVQRV